MRHLELAGEYALYFKWLIDKVGGDEWWDDYMLSLSRLLERKYYYVNPIDEAVYDGGRNLRTEAIFDGVEVMAIPNGETTILEALVFLAEQIDIHLMYNEDAGKRTARWFDDIMTVLNFKKLDGAVDRQIDRFLDGKAQITKRIRYEPYERTLWEQVNQFYSKQFDLESDMM